LAAEEAEIAAIRRLGLTEYEARIYLTLIKMGPIKASELSFFAQVPRTKTYGAVKLLVQKNLVRIIPGKPELYAAQSPIEGLAPLVTKLARDVTDSETIVQDLSIAYEAGRFVKRDIPKTADEFWQIDGRQNLINKLNQMFMDARKVGYCTSAAGLIRVYKTHSEALEKARERGAVVRILAPISQENASVASEISNVLELRNLKKPVGATVVTVDGEQLVVIDSRPDDIRTDRGFDLAIWTTNRLLVGVYERYFDWMWDESRLVEAARHRQVPRVEI
jgi:sugar-specific transcriptional regulator TrmB